MDIEYRWLCDRCSDSSFRVYKSGDEQCQKQNSFNDRVH